MLPVLALLSTTALAAPAPMTQDSGAPVISVRLKTKQIQLDIILCSIVSVG